MVFFGPFLGVFPMDFQAATCRFLRRAEPIAAGSAGKSKSAGADNTQLLHTNTD
jgi:hypothetical protein